MDSGRFNNYEFEPTSRTPSGAGTGGSTALYHHHGSRYGLGMTQRVSSADSKMNGLHGPKHKRGDMDRECQSGYSLYQLDVIRRSVSDSSQPVCRHSTRGFDGRDPGLVQRPARVSIPAEKTRGGRPRASRHDLPRDLWALRRPDDGCVRYDSFSPVIRC